MSSPAPGISPATELNALTLAQQQMVEIALAVSEPNLAGFLILDEPTSALPRGARGAAPAIPE